jgi:ketosteroid isomerase-like protein
MNLPEAAIAGMRKTNALFCTTAIGARDMDALDHVYTEDAHILPPGADIIQGLAAIKKFWKQAVTSLDVMSASLTTVAAEAAGDGIVEIGRAELILAAGQMVAIKYVVHWKLDDDTWKWHTDIWNMNQ